MCGELVTEVRKRLAFLIEVGLEYLTLGRAANTLSGGEASASGWQLNLAAAYAAFSMYLMNRPLACTHETTTG